MSKAEATIETFGIGFKPDLGKQDEDEWKDAPPRSKDVKKRIRKRVDDLIVGIRAKSDEVSFAEVERFVIVGVFGLGRLLLQYFLALRQERSSSLIRDYRRRGFTKRRPQSRQLGTFFGKIRYWRTYMRNSRDGGGVYPLDRSLRLTADKYVVGERFDCAGMRWIKERAQALLQLRCIELNGQWDEFIDFAYARILGDAESTHKAPRVLVNRREARAYAA